jgi:hypothetical protein
MIELKFFSNQQVVMRFMYLRLFLKNSKCNAFTEQIEVIFRYTTFAQ